VSNLVVFDISLSLDGYMRGANSAPDNVLGDGGDGLHSWARDQATDADRQLLADSIGSTGAVICGRRTYDDSLPSWRADGPTGPARLPVFVVSHSAPAKVPDRGVYQFERSIEAALHAAKAAAGNKVVCIMGGADIGQQFIRAGLVDELSIHVAPILLGGGTPMFGDDRTEPAELTTKSVVTSPGATHIRYAFKR
jgi:dihydrofolate reductase